MIPDDPRASCASEMSRLQRERDEALRLAEVLREALRVAKGNLCHLRCPLAGKQPHTDACAKRTRILAGEIALERMTEPQERTARERDEWRAKALDAGKHPAVVALVKELDAARAELKDARRGEAGLRDALGPVLGHLLAYPCGPDPEQCSIVRTLRALLAGEL